MRLLSPTWLHTPECLALGGVTTPLWLSGSWRSFLSSSSVYSCHLFLISSASVSFIPFLSFIVPIFAWNVHLVSLIFLKRYLVFPILLFFSISLHWTLRKTFLSLLAILWNSAFRWISLSFSLLPFSSVQFSSVAQSCLTLCDPMNHSTPGLPVHQQLPESTQTHVHRLSDAIQPSHPLLSPFPPAFNLFQHQGLFQWVIFFASGGQSTGASALASVFPMNIQDWFPWGLTGLISLQFKGLSSLLQHHSSKASVLWCWAFFMVQLSH